MIDYKKGGSSYDGVWTSPRGIQMHIYLLFDSPPLFWKFYANSRGWLAFIQMKAISLTYTTHTEWKMRVFRVTDRRAGCDTFPIVGSGTEMYGALDLTSSSSSSSSSSFSLFVELGAMPDCRLLGDAD